MLPVLHNIDLSELVHRYDKAKVAARHKPQPTQIILFTSSAGSHGRIQEKVDKTVHEKAYFDFEQFFGILGKPEQVFTIHCLT